jgi:hypothetical protein
MRIRAKAKTPSGPEPALQHGQGRHARDGWPPEHDPGGGRPFRHWPHAEETGDGPGRQGRHERAASPLPAAPRVSLPGLPRPPAQSCRRRCLADRPGSGT